MKFITVHLQFSPEAKHAWRWAHTRIGLVAAAAPIAYEHIDAVQGLISERWMHYITAGLIVAMIYNTMRAKGKKK